MPLVLSKQSKDIFLDQVDYACKWMDEARRYYINIVGRQGAAVQKVLKSRWS